MFYLRTMGQLALHVGGPDGRAILTGSKTLLILAILATSRERRQRRDRVADLLWPDVGQSRRQASLRQALHYLSHHAGQSLIKSEDGILSFIADIQVDLWEFDAAVQAGDFATAVDLYAGPLIADLERKLGVELEHWVESENERVLIGVKVGLAQLIAERTARGDLIGAVDYARKLVQLNPLDESGQLALIRALIRSGDDVEALRVYEAFRTLIKEELDEEPSTETEEAVRSIRRDLIQTALNTPGHAPTRERRLTWTSWPALLAGSAGVGGLVLALFTWQSLGPAPSPPPSLFAEIHEASEAYIAEVKLAANVEVRRTSFTPPDVVNRDQTISAAIFHGDRGIDIRLRDLRAQKDLGAFATTEEEYPIQWSPDGRYLLYHAGVADPRENTYEFILGILDTQTRTRRTLSELGDEGSTLGSWSPDGTRIVFAKHRNGESDIFVINFDGTDERNISRRPGTEIGAVWSPNGKEIAFIEDEEDDFNVWVMQADGNNPRRVASFPGRSTRLSWLEPAMLATVVGTSPDRDIWQVNVLTGESRQLTSRGDFSTLRPDFWPGSVSWIEELSITPKLELVSPGQRVTFDVSLRDRNGRDASVSEKPLTWDAVPTSLATISADGQADILRVGEARIIASLGGWRADTLELVSVPLTKRDISVAFHEDWTEGFVAGRWILYGDPLPYTRPVGGPAGAGIFVSNGDRNYRSGAITRRGFPVHDGLTVEVWGRTPFQGVHWQDYAIGLYSELPPSDSIDWRTGFARALVFCNGFRMLCITSTDGDWQDEIPLPDNYEDWHLYALQLEQEGNLSFLVDGKLRWRSTWRLDTPDSGLLHVGLGTNSDSVEILHGPLQVFTGVKYTQQHSP